jgi:hypothetical protein
VLAPLGLFSWARGHESGRHQRSRRPAWRSEHEHQRRSSLVLRPWSFVLGPWFLELASLGLDKLPTQGLALRTVIRGAIFGDQELESVVTKIGEEKVAASVFEIPAGYTEVPAPKIGGVQ